MANLQLDKPISDKMEKHLNGFNIYRALAFDSRKMGALALNDFFNFAISNGNILMREEKGAAGQQLASFVRKCFLYLDSDKDGLLSPKDAGKDGFINDYSRIQARYEQVLLGGKPYSALRDRGNRGLDSIGKASIRYMDMKRREIDASRVKKKLVDSYDAYVYSYTVPIIYLEPEQEGARILHMSDLHFKVDGRRNAGKVEFINSLKGKVQEPDIVIITGDIINDIAGDFVSEGKEALAGLFRGAKRFFVLGNHDFLGGAAGEVAQALENAGYENITNRHTVVDVKGKPFGITGVDDFQKGVKWVPAIPESSILIPNILATHNLDTVDGSYPGSFDLVLTGHTHLGEMNFVLFDIDDLVRLFDGTKNTNRQKEEWGVATQRTVFHITSGLGTHTSRFNGIAEGVSYITLKCG